MRVLRIHEPGRVAIDELPDPSPGPRDVVVRVHACGVCGTDIGYVSRGGLAGPGEPFALGHEMAGTVVEAGAEVASVGVGDRVVVHPGSEAIGRIGNGAPEGGLADVLLVREADLPERLLRVPDGMDLAYAALTEPVAVGMHAAERLELPPGSTAAIIGCGPVGMAALAALLDAGASSVVAIEPSEPRRRIALELGAVAALDPSEPGVFARLSEVHGSHPDWGTPATSGFVEASGSAAMLTEIIANASPRARISVPAVHMADVPVSMLLVLMKELEIRGAMEYPDRFEDALDLLRRRDLSPMLTNLVTLEEVASALVDPASMRAAGKTMAILAGAER